MLLCLLQTAQLQQPSVFVLIALQARLARLPVSLRVLTPGLVNLSATNRTAYVLEVAMVTTVSLRPLVIITVTMAASAKAARLQAHKIVVNAASAGENNKTR